MPSCRARRLLKRKPAAGRNGNVGPTFLESAWAKHSKSFKSVQPFEPGIPLLGVYQKENKTQISMEVYLKE